MNWSLALFRTDGRIAPAVLRLGLASVMFAHGAQKLLGWFGGSGFAGTLQMFTEALNIPAALAVVAILTEFLAPLLLLFGFLTRLAALALGILISVAALMVHLPHGFFMNWSQQKSGEGFEFHILVLAIALALLFQGGGKWSLDSLVHRRLSAKARTRPAP